MNLTLIMIIPVLCVVAFIIYAVKIKDAHEVTGKIAVIGIGIILVMGCLIPIINASENNMPLIHHDQENELDVFMILGQSNAAYGVYDAAIASPTPDYGTSYYFGSDSGPVYFLGSTVQSGSYSLDGMTSYDMDNINGRAKIGNIELPFAGEYTQYSGHDVYIINGGVPGTSITAWQDGSYCNTYAKTVFTTAMGQIDLTAYDSVNLCSILWIQGENDAYMISSMYVDYFLSMWDSLKTWSYEGQTFDSIVLSQTRYDTAPNSSIAQGLLGDGEYSGVYLGSTAANDFTVAAGTLVDDGIHYSQKGDNIIGVQLARYCLQMRY